MTRFKQNQYLFIFFSFGKLELGEKLDIGFQRESELIYEMNRVNLIRYYFKAIRS